MSRTFRDAVADYFRGNPHQWVSAYVLMEIGGRMAWRTRKNECEHQLGMTILNRQRREHGCVISEYKYVPAVGQQALPWQGAA